MIALTPEQTHEMASDAGLDWHAGFALDDEDNRYAKLARAAFDAGRAAARDAVLHACNESLGAVPQDKPISGEWDRGFRDGLGCAITVVRAALHRP